MENGRTFEASKIKQYTDLLFRLHRRYVEQIKENEELKPMVAKAETTMRMALVLTANSDEAMQHLKQSLSK